MLVGVPDGLSFQMTTDLYIGIRYLRGKPDGVRIVYHRGAGRRKLIGYLLNCTEN